jgi:hypothetical protein
MFNRVCFLFVVLCLIPALSPASFAATITATSCAQSAVQAAINSAADGDTVIIPAGSSSWSGRIRITNKSLSIIGGGAGKTVITDQTGSSEQLFDIDTGGRPFRLSGFSFQGTPNDYVGHIRISGGNFRIDHCDFQTSGWRKSISVWGDGLIDNCSFGVDSRGLQLYGSNANWYDSSAYAPGTAAGLFVEDCTFRNNNNIIESYTGARWVFRHNTVYNGGMLDGHGADSTDRSFLYAEIYNNHFYKDGSSKFCVVNLRGGSAIIFNNVFEVGAYSQHFRLINYRTGYALNRSSVSYAAANNNACNGSSTNPLDGKQDATGYPCKDQVGRGPNQHSYPAYEWDNKQSDGQSVTFSLGDPWGSTNPSMSDHIKHGRDYFNGTRKPGYTPYHYPHPRRGTQPESLKAPGNLKIMS